MSATQDRPSDRPSFGLRRSGRFGLVRFALGGAPSGGVLVGPVRAASGRASRSDAGPDLVRPARAGFGGMRRMAAVVVLLIAALLAPLGRARAETAPAPADTMADATATAGPGAPAAAAALSAAAPMAAELLFERPQLKGTVPGRALVYRYHRKVPDPELGPSFDDTIRLDVSAPTESASADARDVRVELFSGERHRAAGPFPGVTGNPVLILMLETHVEDLAGRLKGNPRYLKNAIRAALREKAEVEPATITVDGRPHQGWRVRIRPFAGDANARRLRGLDTLVYDFEVAPDLPGEIASITISADAPAGRLFEEALTYDPKGS